MGALAALDRKTLPMLLFDSSIVAPDMYVAHHPKALSLADRSNAQLAGNIGSHGQILLGPRVP